jgi:hypothetical protein
MNFLPQLSHLVQSLCECFAQCLLLSEKRALTYEQVRDFCQVLVNGRLTASTMLQKNLPKPLQEFQVHLLFTLLPLRRDGALYHFSYNYLFSHYMGIF